MTYKSEDEKLTTSPNLAKKIFNVKLKTALTPENTKNHFLEPLNALAISNVSLPYVRMQDFLRTAANSQKNNNVAILQ